MRRLIAALFSVIVLASPGVASAANQKLTAATSEGLQSIVMYIARMQGFFEQEGIDFEFVTLASGNAQTAALLSGNVDFLPTSYVNLIRAKAQGADLVAFAILLEQYPLNIVLSNDAMTKTGITLKMPIEEKVKRFKGLTIGITAPGSSTDLFARSIFIARGLDPAQFISLQPIGDGPTTWAAFQRKLMDGFSNTSPWVELAQANKLGEPAFDPFTGELPELKDVPYHAMATSRKTLAEKPQLVAATARALTRALRFAQSNPNDVRKIRQYFPSVDEQAFNLAVDKYRAAMPPKSLVITRAHTDKTLVWMNLGEKNPVTVKYEDLVITGPAAEADAAVK